MTTAVDSDATVSGARSAHIEQALTILRQTNDGDDLSPGDLALVQMVVNSTLDSLNDVGRAKWSKLLEDTRTGAYQQAWFHGVENLSRDHNGYVKWRGRVVEHYDFPSERRAHEEVAAKRLGAVCRRLERDGVVPRSGTVMGMYDRLRTGGELGDSIPRFAVVMLLNRSDRIDLRVKKLAGLSDVQIVAEAAEFLDQTRQSYEGGEPHRYTPSVMTVVTQEDYDNVVEAVTGHVSWARRVSGAGWSECMRDEPRTSLAALEAACTRAALATPQQIEVAYLGEAFPEPAEEPVRDAERSGG